MAKHGEPAYPPSSYGDGWLGKQDKPGFGGDMPMRPSMDAESALDKETKAHKEIQRMSIVKGMKNEPAVKVLGKVSPSLPPIRDVRVAPDNQGHSRAPDNQGHSKAPDNQVHSMAPHSQGHGSPIEAPVSSQVV